MHIGAIKLRICKNFHIDTDEKKGAAATHVAGYEFFNRYHGGLLTNISNKKNTHFVSNNIGKQNEIVFTNDNVGVKFCNPIYSPTSLRFGDAIYAFAGFVLEDYNKQFIGYWDNSLVKAWCAGVEWFVAKDYYETFDDRQGLIRDLIDSDNSTHDNVSGLSIEALNKCMLNTYTWDGFKNKVKLLVSSDSEKNNIDELFSYWKSLY